MMFRLNRYTDDPKPRIIKTQHVKSVGTVESPVSTRSARSNVQSLRSLRLLGSISRIRSHISSSDPSSDPSSDRRSDPQ